MTGFFTTIVELAHERPITAADFTPFIGHSNVIAFDKGEPLGNCDTYPDAKWLSGVVYPFRLIGTYKTVEPFDRIGYGVKPGQCLIAVEMTDVTERWMAMDADELAIRMDAS